MEAFITFDLKIVENLSEIAKMSKISTGESLFIKNLSIRCQEEDLREVLTSCEEVDVVEIKYDAKLVGFAFVNFTNTETAKSNLEKLQGAIIHGRKLK